MRLKIAGTLEVQIPGPADLGSAEQVLVGNRTIPPDRAEYRVAVTIKK